MDSVILRRSSTGERRTASCSSTQLRAFAEMEQETYCDGFLEIRSKGPGILQTTG